MRKNGRIAFDRNLDSSSIIINEKLDMTTNRSELIARCGNESLKNSLLTPFFFFFSHCGIGSKNISQATEWGKKR